MRTLGFDADNQTFTAHSWYFRNALVRANYTDVRRGVFATTEYVEMFFRNLLMGETNELKNRDLLINVVDGVGEMSEKYRENVGEMSQRGGRIVEMMRKDRYITAKQLAKEFNITERTIEREIKKLKEAGVVERMGGDRGGFWKQSRIDNQ